MAPQLAADDIARIFRMAVVGAAGVAVAALVVGGLLGHLLLGVGLCAGLVLGAANSLGMRGMAGRVAALGGGKRPAVTSSLRRLGLVTLVVVGILLLSKQAGLATVVGLGLFQFVMLVGSSRVLLRALREGSAGP